MVDTSSPGLRIASTVGVSLVLGVSGALATAVATGAAICKGNFCMAPYWWGVVGWVVGAGVGAWLGDRLPGGQADLAWPFLSALAVAGVGTLLLWLATDGFRLLMAPTVLAVALAGAPVAAVIGAEVSHRLKFVDGTTPGVALVPIPGGAMVAVGAKF